MKDFNETNGVGSIHISDDVIAVIVGTATLEVSGVYALAGNLTGEISEMLGRKNFGKGIHVSVEDKNVEIDVSIHIRFGEDISKLGTAVQKGIKTAVETMTGLTVKKVNVNVLGVQPEKELQR